MIRLTLMAVAMLIGFVPMAQAATCKEQVAEVTKLMDAAVSATKKQAAMKDMELAKQAMEKLDESSCLAHAQSVKKILSPD